MKFLDKVGLVLFSFIVLVIAMLICFLVFGWISVDNVSYVLNTMLNSPLFSIVFNT